MRWTRRAWSRCSRSTPRWSDRSASDRRSRRMSCAAPWSWSCPLARPRPAAGARRRARRPDPAQQALAAGAGDFETLTTLDRLFHQRLYGGCRPARTLAAGAQPQRPYRPLRRLHLPTRRQGAGHSAPPPADLASIAGGRPDEAQRHLRDHLSTPRHSSPRSAPATLLYRGLSGGRPDRGSAAAPARTRPAWPQAFDGEVDEGPNLGAKAGSSTARASDSVPGRMKPARTRVKAHRPRSSAAT